MVTKSIDLQVIESIEELKKILNRNDRKNATVGLVPTMGFLHKGHLSLVKHAKKQNDIVVMSIFVNPAQFGPGEDFESYPRDRERDLRLASNAGVDIVFMPSVKEMYPTDGGIRILPGNQADALCGASRPGHFDGVLKVVLKLFNIVDPDRSYFGVKDAQQLAIIETFVRDFNLRTTIERVPIVREEDGLAKSSRNVNLTTTERTKAPAIHRALQNGADMFANGFDAKAVIQHVTDEIVSNSSGTIDYVNMLTYPELGSLTNDAQEVILACAVKFTATRLIDNIIMSTKDGTYVSNDDEQ